MKTKILLFLVLGLLIGVNPSYATFTKYSGPQKTAVLAASNQNTGLTVHALQQPEPTKSKTTTFVLLLIGVLALPIGLHRFYLGYKTEGILMLILTLTGIGAIVSWIWTIIDLIKFLDGNLKPADGSDYRDKSDDVI